MEFLGNIKERQIFYTNIRVGENWQHELPTNDWIVFTIVDDLDRDLINEVVEICLDKSVVSICCAGKLSSLTEFTFDEEIVKRAIREENKTGLQYDYELSPVTTSHNNFSDGFWYATMVAFGIGDTCDAVVCIDCTKQGVKKHLTELIPKINDNWLPSDEDFEDPEYDE